MTEGPPPSAASTSKVTLGSENTQSQIPASTMTSFSISSNGKTKQQYGGKTIWPTAWPAQQNGISIGASPMTTPTESMSFSSDFNPYHQHHRFKPTQTYKPVWQKPRSNAQAIEESKDRRSPSPGPVDFATFKDWDDVVKRFLLKTKMTETLKGFESDMLVLNSEWEQKMIPGALNEMVVGLQVILNRVAGKAKQDDNNMDVDTEVDIIDGHESDEVNYLNQRKLKYVHLSNGLAPRPQSAINKSISEFLSRTRARNDASNRAEFLLTLAEKKRKMAEDLRDDEETTAPSKITSCARVDAKKIDRDKQIKYDIAKYGEGPLISTVKSTAGPTPVTTALEETFVIQPPPEMTKENDEKEPPTTKKTRQKRKFVYLDDDAEESEEPSGKSSKRSKRKGKTKAKKRQKVEEEEEGNVEHEEHDAEEKALSLATAEKHPGIDSRLKTIETHLAVRFVPTPPRTLLSRLIFLEDHIIKLEKEYPPWAALHFNQPNRGWPPPPRTTPIIVPPHLRIFSSTPAVPLEASTPSSSTTPSVTPLSAPPSDLVTGISSVVTKPKKIRSSLHKAVLERMEVQRAMSEIGGKSG